MQDKSKIKFQIRVPKEKVLKELTNPSTEVWIEMGKNLKKEK